MLERSVTPRSHVLALVLVAGCGGDGTGDGEQTGSSSGSSTGRDTEASTAIGTETSSGSADTAAESSTADGDSTGTGTEGVVVRVATLNIQLGGLGGGGSAAMAEVIEASGADVVGLQESFGAASGIARELGWNSAGAGDVAFVTRFPITRESSESVRVEACPGHEIVVGNVHLAPYPYGPYDLRDDPALTPEELIAAANEARADAIASALGELQADLDSDAAVFLVGDFNEPSHLDWTEAAAEAGHHLGASVAWPTSDAVVAAGLVDTYRALVPDEVEDLGETWTPDPGPDEVHDRIDLLYHAGSDVIPLEVAIVGENRQMADIVVDPYPTDHRAVVAGYRLQGIDCGER